MCGLGHFMIGPGHTTRTTRSRSVSVAPCFESIARIVDVRIARIAFDAIVVIVVGRRRR